ncbi:MAG: hypothetical protein LBQ05_02000 [Christensenellaceae bacterium]|jgi:protein-arginine kinase activator protein McsA|nr:hypothetical protein [Christensenellaceae bacterium]
MFWEEITDEEPRIIVPVIVKQCPVCGMKFRQYESTGYLGCSACYRFFWEELIPYIEVIDGTR